MVGEGENRTSGGVTISINIGIRVSLRLTGRWDDVIVGKCRLRDTASARGRVNWWKI